MMNMTTAFAVSVTLQPCSLRCNDPSECILFTDLMSLLTSTSIQDSLARLDALYRASQGQVTFTRVTFMAS